MPTRISQDVFAPKDNTPDDDDLTVIEPDETIAPLLATMQEGDTIRVQTSFDMTSNGQTPLPLNETPPWATSNEKVTEAFLRAKLHYTMNDAAEYQAKGEHGSILWRTDVGRPLRVYVNGYASNHLTEQNVYHLAKGLEIGMNR